MSTTKKLPQNYPKFNFQIISHVRRPQITKFWIETSDVIKNCYIENFNNSNHPKNIQKYNLKITKGVF